MEERRKNHQIVRCRLTERRTCQILGGTNNHQPLKTEATTSTSSPKDTVKDARELLSSKPPVNKFPKFIFYEETTKTEKPHTLRVRRTQAEQTENCKEFAETQTGICGVRQKCKNTA